MPGLKIVDAGLLTTVQDAGRPGFQRLGVPVSGAVDRDCLMLANAMVDNPPTQAALEMRYMGVTVEAVGGPVALAIAGTAAEAVLTHPGGETETIPGWRSLLLAEGARLKLTAFPDTATAYLAVKGGVDVAAVMGSAATYVASGIGGFEGRALKAGDLLPVAGSGDGAAEAGRPMGFEAPPDLGAAKTIRVVPGPQRDAFTDAAMETFLATDWEVTKDADRMGLRLEGPELEHTDGFNITSDGTASGSIQIPGTGKPIILLVDRQTTGGYPKIATVVSADLPVLGRKRPGDSIRFEAVSVADAIALRRAHEDHLRELMSRIGPVRGRGAVDLDALYRAELITGMVEEARSQEA